MGFEGYILRTDRILFDGLNMDFEKFLSKDRKDLFRVGTWIWNGYFLRTKRIFFDWLDMDFKVYPPRMKRIARDSHMGLHRRPLQGQDVDFKIIFLRTV